MGVRAKIPIPASLVLCLNLAFRKVRLRSWIPGLDPSGGLSCRASAEPHAENTEGSCSIPTGDNPRWLWVPLTSISFQVLTV